MSNGYIYVLKCFDGTYYTGMTRNIVNRLRSHYTGKGSVYTKARLPVKIVFLTESTNPEKAEARYRHIVKTIGDGIEIRKGLPIKKLHEYVSSIGSYHKDAFLF